MQWAQRQEDELKNQWAEGNFTALNQYGTTIANAKAIGNCEMLDKLKNVEVMDLYEESIDG